ncbi:MAG: ATP-dependent DNA ligase [Burkholderiales bacterium]
MSSLRELARPSIGHRDLMFATPGKLFSARGWIFELKYDGFRCLVTKCGDVVRLESKNGRDMSSLFPELAEEIGPIRDDFVADCELVVLDDQGCPQWERLQRRAVLRHTHRIQQAAAEDPACIFAFDLLWLNGADFRPRPLLERKQALKRTLPGNRRIRYTGHLDSSADLWRLAVQMDLEGIVAKETTSIYTAGPSTRWLTIEADDVTERKRQRHPG